jgi:class 3 adenylate cyclase
LRSPTGRSIGSSRRTHSSSSTIFPARSAHRARSGADHRDLRYGRRGIAAARLLATVLFADIAGSTERVAAIGDNAGIAVHTGARVANLATPGEVLVSQTVRDLVAGSGLAFEDRGSHRLKGVPGERRPIPGCCALKISAVHGRGRNEDFSSSTEAGGGRPPPAPTARCMRI